MIKLVAFDLDGTVADTIPMCLAAFGKAVSPYAGHTLSEEEIVQTFGLNELGMIKAIVKERYEEALQDFYIQYEAMHGQCDKPFDGIVDFIELLKTKGLIVCMITGKGQRSCEITLEKLGMSHLFADVFTGSEERNIKGESLRALAEKYDVSADECLYIGDAISDVIYSREAGVTCLSAAWSDSVDAAPLREINEGNVFTSISQLVDAFYDRGYIK